MCLWARTVALERIFIFFHVSRCFILQINEKEKEKRKWMHFECNLNVSRLLHNIKIDYCRVLRCTSNWHIKKKKRKKEFRLSSPSVRRHRYHCKSSSFVFKFENYSSAFHSILYTILRLCLTIFPSSSVAHSLRTLSLWLLFYQRWLLWCTRTHLHTHTDDYALFRQYISFYLSVLYFTWMRKLWEIKRRVSTNGNRCTYPLFTKHRRYIRRHDVNW